MELGNLIFGNSRGVYPLKRGVGFEEEFKRLNELITTDDYVAEFENDTFATFPYWWGECECGYDLLEMEWNDNHEHNKGCYQSEYRKINKPDNIFPDKDEVEKLCEKHGIPYNKGYGSAVHCTCGFENLWREFCEANSHKSDCPIVKPNFCFKATGFQIQWYKYPFRDSYTNEEITLAEFRAMINTCMASLK